MRGHALCLRLALQAASRSSTRSSSSNHAHAPLRGFSTASPLFSSSPSSSPSGPSASNKEELDHRAIGTAQKLFFTHESSPGTPFMLPHGVRISNKIERVIRDLYRKWGYEEVITPQIFKSTLWKKSGHWENYRDDMFAVEGFKKEEQEEEMMMLEQRNRSSCCGGDHHSSSSSPSSSSSSPTFGLKPMNCPGHCVMFASQEHSYRDLPIRYAEFSPLHRNEPSGSLTGLTRVRRFHQDDAHVFCRPDQIASEIANMLEMLQSAYRTFHFPSFDLVLSTRPDKFLGKVEDWDRAEQGLTDALNQSGMKWELNEADGAFYGPKIDIRLVDASGKRHQTATIQLDFQLPSRFELQYDDPNASSSSSTPSSSPLSPSTAPSEGQTQGGKARPVMIHRAILGSMERFMAILIEHTQGKWPFWLSPRQAIVIPISVTNESMVEYARKVQRQLSLDTSENNGQGVDSEKTRPRNSSRQNHFFHVDVESSTETLNKRIKRAQLNRYNFILVVGEEEMAKGTVNVRSTHNSEARPTLHIPALQKNMGSMSIDDLRRLFITLDDNHC